MLVWGRALARPSRTQQGSLTEDDPTAPMRPMAVTQEQEDVMQEKGAGMKPQRA
jgi:hypothetical protein